MVGVGGAGRCRFSYMLIQRYTGLQRDAKHLLRGQISASAESLAFLRPIVTEAVLCMDWPPSHPFAAILSSLIDQLRQKY